MMIALLLECHTLSMTTVGRSLLSLLAAVDSLLALSRSCSMSLLIRARRPVLLDGIRVVKIVLPHRSNRGSVPARRLHGHSSQMMILYPP